MLPLPVMTKKNTNVDEPEVELTSFLFPEQAISIKAETQEEAELQAKKIANKEKEE